MRNLLVVLAIMVVVAWAIGFIGYNAGGLIHLLLVYCFDFDITWNHSGKKTELMARAITRFPLFKEKSEGIQ